jgi:quercetin dioxygenase-like cupin family protein
MQKSNPSGQCGLILPNVSSNSAVTEPEPGLTRQVLVHSAAMMLVRHQMRKGWRGAPHKHPHEQMVYILNGRVQIFANGVEHETTAGDNFIVAANVEHHAIALEDSIVLDIFTPAREDYL